MLTYCVSPLPSSMFDHAGLSWRAGKEIADQQDCAEVGRSAKTYKILLVGRMMGEVQIVSSTGGPAKNDHRK